MTFPLTDRFNTTLFINWLKPQITSGARVFAGREPDVGRIIVVSSLAGPGLTLDGLFDIVGMQIRCRGGESNYQDAENIALEVDSILLTSPTAFDIGDVRVLGFGRTGGAPQVLPQPDTEGRFTATCTYYAEVSTNL